MRVLVTWGSKLGGTEGIGVIVAGQLAARGHRVVAEPAEDVESLDGIEAVVVGGALCANRWPAPLRRFIRRNTEALRKVPVWFFSSGPLDDSADRAPIPAPTQVAVLAERVGAKGHVTFGGRLEPTVKGFPAEAMAKTNSGDWRNPERIRAWADGLAAELPAATPGPAIDHAAASPELAIGVGAFGWACCAVLAHIVTTFAGPSAAAVARGIAAPLFFTGLAWTYFRARGAREPLPVAFSWSGIFLGLDLALAAARGEGAWLLTRVAATWLPLTFVFLLTWGTGAVVSTLPWPKLPPRKSPPPLVPHPR